MNRIIGDKIVDNVRDSKNGEQRNRNYDAQFLHARSVD
jgi:hypothetical protein